MVTSSITRSTCSSWRPPLGAFLEARFENPADAENPFIVGHALTEAGRRVRLESPALPHVKPTDYGVELRIYRDDSRSELLGVHRQSSRCPLDTERAKTMTEAREAVGGRR